MFQLCLPLVSRRQAIREMKQSGRAFTFKTPQGWIVWLPFRPKWITGMAYVAEDWSEAVEAVDEFNQQLTAEQQKGST